MFPLQAPFLGQGFPNEKEAWGCGGQRTDLQADPEWRSQASAGAGKVPMFYRKLAFLPYVRCEVNHWPTHKNLYIL